MTCTAMKFSTPASSAYGVHRIYRLNLFFTYASSICLPVGEILRHTCDYRLPRALLLLPDQAHAWIPRHSLSVLSIPPFTSRLKQHPRRCAERAGEMDKCSLHTDYQ